MEWIYLLIAGCLEIVWAISLKYTEGFTCFWPSVLTGAAMLGSIFLLDESLKNIPIGTAYAVWTGIGAVGTAIIGMFYLGEPKEFGRVFCIILIVLGVVGLKFNFFTIK
ncbi:quaternary ammonium compound-resistance protein SugE [Propionispira arboris]|uniref:Quaternary ammonium compound-resistance protein SugE n=1 Tax=Propionispira arboris TaxID=84035 RepID=A0A1H7BYG3_9FIRM|nr:multidrug efflux SMR transporter [Propionispira arboris]SEJ79410.1 quaternary ammonium compound-resistance protein SugE [Propionispira arboris]